MARLFLGTLLLLILGIGGVAAWLGSGGEAVVELSDDELEAARNSGAGARDIVIDTGEDEPALPTMEELKELVDRDVADGMATRVREARVAASGDERALLTVLLAEIERTRGNLDVAYDLAVEGAEALPDNSRARFTLAQAIMSRLIQQGEDGGMGAIVKSLGDVKLYQGELQAAIDLDPANVDARVRQIIVFAFGPWPIGNKKKAGKLIEELGRFDEFQRDFWRAQLLVADDKKIDEAIAAFEALDARRPDDKDVVYNLGELYAKKDDWPKTAQTFDRLIVEPRTRRSYQAMYQSAKAREKGEFELEKALAMLDEYRAADPIGDLMPSMDRITYHRGNVLAKLGRAAEAKAAYETSLQLKPGSERVEKALRELEATPTDG